MAIRTKKELRDDIKNVTRETQIDAYINEYINITLDEMVDPAWAFEQVSAMRGYNHKFSFLRRKHYFTTVASQETYNLPRDLDKISLVRQITTPARIISVPDDVFYTALPYPTATGTPLFYRLWEEEGVSTTLAVADTIDVVSSSASDSTAIKVSIVGYDSNGILQSEELTLNGVTAVTGTITFVANRPLRISKSGATTGSLTFTEHSGGTTLVVLGPEERTARFKAMGLYPIPSAAINIYLEYYTRLRPLVNDSDVPDIDEKWIWVLRQGAIAKVYQYQGKESMYNSAQGLYATGVRSMVKADMGNMDYIPVLKKHAPPRVGVVELADDSFSLTF